MGVVRRFESGLMHLRAALPGLWPGAPVRGSIAALQSWVHNDRYIGCPSSNVYIYPAPPAACQVARTCAGCRWQYMHTTYTWRESTHSNPYNIQPRLLSSSEAIEEMEEGLKQEETTVNEQARGSFPPFCYQAFATRLHV